MGLAETQRALAKLYTDAALRRRFLADPHAVGLELGLDDEEAAELARVSSAQLDFFASSLKAKRLNEVSKLLPLTRRVLGARFDALFHKYAETYLPSGTHKHHDDAVAFTSYLEAEARAGDGLPSWLPELSRYEAAWLEAGSPVRRLIVYRFHYVVDKLARSITRTGKPSEVEARLTVGVWFRPSKRGRLRHKMLSLPHRTRSTAQGATQTQTTIRGGNRHHEQRPVDHQR